MARQQTARNQRNLIGSSPREPFVRQLSWPTWHLCWESCLLAIGISATFRPGIAAASLYLLLPYTSQMTGRVDYVVPALLLVWAVAAYRRPVLSGLLIGLAAGCIFYPIFLLPLWLSFYWKRGVFRFLIGLAIGLIVLMIFWLATSAEVQSFGDQLVDFFGIRYFDGKDADGFWANHARLPYRIPIIAGFAAICGSLALWPAQKHLGTLISCTALVMLGTQFWHPYEGRPLHGMVLAAAGPHRVPAQPRGSCGSHGRSRSLAIATPCGTPPRRTRLTAT